MDGGGSGLTKGQVLHSEERVMKRMCQDLEEMKRETADKNSRMIAERLISMGLSLDMVAEGTNLPREEVEQLAAKKGK